jgi:hypothetical protein
MSKIPALAPGVAGRKSGTNVEVGRHASAPEQEDAKNHARLDGSALATIPLGCWGGERPRSAWFRLVTAAFSILILAWCRPGQEESRNGHRPSWGKFVCVDLFVTGREHQWPLACLRLDSMQARKFRPQRRGDTTQVTAGRDGGGMEGHVSGARAVWHGGGSGRGVTLFVCNVRLCELVCVVVW